MSARPAVSALSRATASSTSRLPSRAPFRATLSTAVDSPAAPSGAPAGRFLDFPPLAPLQRKHGVHVATLHLRAHHPTPLDLFTTFALHSARSLLIPTSGPASLPTTRELYTVLKSPFVHKKAQENFERRTHRRVIKVYDAERDVVDLWLRYLKRNGVGGVGAKAVVYEWVEYGFGRKEVETLEGMMDGGEVERAAEALIRQLGGGEGVELKEVEGLKEGEGGAKAAEASTAATAIDGAETAQREMGAAATLGRTETVSAAKLDESPAEVPASAEARAPVDEGVRAKPAETKPDEPKA